MIEGPVTSGEHGSKAATFVCCHLAARLRTGRAAGFHCAGPEAGSDAWCDACERVREREGGWTDRSEAFAGMPTICGTCYDAARSLNGA